MERMILRFQSQRYECERDTEHQHPNITCVSATLNLSDTHIVGSIKAYRLDAAEMRRLGLGQMWQECQHFDAAHDGAKLDKVENYLANESFPIEYQSRIDQADTILFIGEVWLEKEYRGQDLGLWAVSDLIRKLSLPVATVVLLQAGPVAREISKDDDEKGEAHDKIARHWKRLGFREWSDSGDAWLCLTPAEMSRLEETMGRGGTTLPGVARVQDHSSCW